MSALPSEFHHFAENLYNRFPEVLIALGAPGLEMAFDLRMDGTRSCSIVESECTKKVEVTMRRWVPQASAYVPGMCDIDMSEMPPFFHNYTPSTFEVYNTCHDQVHKPMYSAFAQANSSLMERLELLESSLSLLKPQIEASLVEQVQLQAQAQSQSKQMGAALAPTLSLHAIVGANSGGACSTAQHIDPSSPSSMDQHGRPMITQALGATTSVASHGAALPIPKTTAMEVSNEQVQVVAPGNISMIGLDMNSSSSLQRTSLGNALPHTADVVASDCQLRSPMSVNEKSPHGFSASSGLSDCFPTLSRQHSPDDDSGIFLRQCSHMTVSDKLFADIAPLKTVQTLQAPAPLKTVQTLQAPALAHSHVALGASSSLLARRARPSLTISENLQEY